MTSAAVGFALALDYRDALAALVLVDVPPPGTTALDSLRMNPLGFRLALHANVDVATMLITGKEREYLSHFMRSLSPTPKVHCVKRTSMPTSVPIRPPARSAPL